MLKSTENRVLSRISARELTEQEISAVSGGLSISKCTFDPVTCVMDGQCSPPPGC